MVRVASIKCEQCGKSTPWRGSNQRYCEPCSEARDLERKRKWSNAHPLTAEQREASRPAKEARKARLRAAGAARSETASMYWMAERPPPGLCWELRVKVPFTYRMSKNAIWASSPHGHTYLRREARQARSDLQYRLQHAIEYSGQRIAQNRLWLDILVEKSNHRGDALNMLDLIADAVKDACGLDDRWFSIRRLDWSVVTNGTPYVYVGIGQESAEDVIVCSYCGRMLALDSFNKNRSGPLGRCRVCRECSRAEDRVKRAARGAPVEAAEGEQPAVHVAVLPAGGAA